MSESEGMQDFLSLLSRQLDLQRLSVSSNQPISGSLIKLIAKDLPINASHQTRIAIATNGEACTLEEIIDSGILQRSLDTFIACDRL